MIKTFGNILGMLLDTCCLVCASPLPANQLICGKCTDSSYNPCRTAGEYEIYHAGYYTHPLSQIITLYKYHSHPRISTVLSGLLSRLYTDMDMNLQDFTVTFIPSNRKSIFEKGFTPAELIAKKFSHTFGLEFRKIFSSESKERQVTLDKDRRNSNVKLYIDGHIPKKTVIIDDVYTTGATMRTACRLLAEQSLRVVGITVAKTS